MGLKGNKYTRQIDLLRLIKLNEPVTGPQLAVLLGKTRQAIHLRLRQMERRGLIERIPPAKWEPIIPVQYRCSMMLRELEKEIVRQDAQEED